MNTWAFFVFYAGSLFVLFSLYFRISVYAYHFFEVLGSSCYIYPPLLTLAGAVSWLIVTFAASLVLMEGCLCLVSYYMYFFLLGSSIVNKFCGGVYGFAAFFVLSPSGGLLGMYVSTNQGAALWCFL